MRSHYGKVICACCFLALFVNIGLNSTSFAVYQPYIVALPGVGDSAGSIVVSTRIFVSIIATVFVDRFYGFLDMRRGLALATALTGLGFVVYGLADGLPMLLLGAAVTGVAYGLGGLVATTTLVNRWFKSSVGTAVGVASVGSGVAGIVVPVAAARIIEDGSLAASFLWEAALALALAVVILVLLRDRPSDMGLAPYESDGFGRARGNDRSRAAGRELTDRERAAVLAAMTMLGGFSMAGISYLSVLFVSNGFDIHLAALLLSVAGVCLTVAKFVVGELFDRVGTPLASGIVFVILAVGFGLCCMAGSGAVAVAAGAAVCVGAGLSLGSVGLSVWSIELSTPDVRAKSIKNCQVAYSAGGFAMNILPGPLKDLTGTYVTAYAVMLALTLAAAVIILLVYRMTKPVS